MSIGFTIAFLIFISTYAVVS